MKIISTIILCLTGVLLVAQPSAVQKNKVKQKGPAKAGTVKTYSVSGSVSQTFSYCGGAAPSTEVMEGENVESPYTGKTFYVKKGPVNSVNAKTILSFTTDKKGHFSFRLPKGVYSIIQSQQLKPLKLSDYTSNEYHSVDEKCLREWWAKPYYLLEVKGNDITGLSFVFHHPCFISGDIPCIQYIGPMPP